MNNKCPCCSNVLLKHWEQKKTYWYCVTCRQEMPNLELVDFVNRYQQQGREIIDRLAAKRPLITPIT